MFGIKIRKSDQPLLTLLNGGTPVEVPKATSYLVVNPAGENLVVTEKVFDAEYASKISSAGPVLYKLNKN